ncbi:hypothetical protein BV25DRAFT_1914422 [Artomyces pyxidatus]|uniref:Uncharacterized protein n=1 Tax=Artomyces pyxidatus TaxID=48021 RepID=A0ACB8T7F7_9AGAM|nr:hypothetical protein BV25DRAFT_1914422 [Artomyces pyxidatus]
MAEQQGQDVLGATAAVPSEFTFVTQAEQPAPAQAVVLQPPNVNITWSTLNQRRNLLRFVTIILSFLMHRTMYLQPTLLFARHVDPGDLVGIDAILVQNAVFIWDVLFVRWNLRVGIDNSYGELELDGLHVPNIISFICLQFIGFRRMCRRQWELRIYSDGNDPFNLIGGWDDHWGIAERALGWLDSFRFAARELGDEIEIGDLASPRVLDIIRVIFFVPWRPRERMISLAAAFEQGRTLLTPPQLIGIAGTQEGFGYQIRVEMVAHVAAIGYVFLATVSDRHSSFAPAPPVNIIAGTSLAPERVMARFLTAQTQIFSWLNDFDPNTNVVRLNGRIAYYRRVAERLARLPEQPFTGAL